MNHAIHKAPPVFVATLAALSVVALAILVHPSSSEAVITPPPSGGAVTGWAWSDTVGWIDLNCSNDNTCGTSNYGLSIDDSGNLSGYAWSDNVGWVSANASDLTGCPTAPCGAKMSGSTITGWLKALSGGEAQSGGWDGFISLSGSGYGPTLSGGVFSGYSWGDTNIGWMDWSLARTTYSPCVSQNICSGDTVINSCTNEVVENGNCSAQGQICSAGACIVPPPPSDAPFSTFTGHLTAKPALVHTGETTKVYWNISDVVDSSCSVTGNGNSWTGLAFSGSGGKTTSRITSQTIYTLSCTGIDHSIFTETATVNIIPVFQEQ
jgi:hypothetical protein